MATVIAPAPASPPSCHTHRATVFASPDATPSRAGVPVICFKSSALISVHGSGAVGGGPFVALSCLLHAGARTAVIPSVARKRRLILVIRVGQTFSSGQFVSGQTGMSGPHDPG